MHIAFEDKTVLVVGAARGIGRSIVEAFATRGATVWAADILTEEIEAAHKGAKGNVRAVKVDVTADKFSASAKAAIENAGGSVTES